MIEYCSSTKMYSRLRYNNKWDKRNVKREISVSLMELQMDDLYRCNYLKDIDRGSFYAWIFPAVYIPLRIISDP